MILTEIKKGQTGTGILVENDGYLSLDIPANKELKESFGIDAPGQISLKDLPRPFVVSAVFQKFGIENANGRIYPEMALKNAVAKYMEAVNDRRGYGECYTPDVLVLTETGWKQLADVKEGEIVLTLNPKTNKIELNPVRKKISYQVDEDLIRIKGRSIDELVTKGHRFPIYDRNGKFRDFYTAEEILNKKVPSQSHCFIPKTGVWDGFSMEFFTLPGIENPTSYVLTKHPDCKEDIQIKIEDFMKFMGIYLSEGSVRKSRNSNEVQITQKKEETSTLIEELLNSLPFEWRDDKKKNGTHNYIINDPRLKTYLEKFGKCYDKYVPYEIKCQSKENLKIFYDWFVLGDGRVRGDRRIKSGSFTDDVFSTSKQLALDLNEIQLKIGYCGSYHEEDRKYDRIIEGREIKAENCHDMYFTLRSLSKGVYLDERFIKAEKEHYNGVVQCIEVENHTWFVMSNGKCHWTGNCNHPDGEVAIDLERLSMNIVELHWEGHTLVGKMEIPVSEAYRNYGMICCLADLVAHWLLSGLKIGVSSRGLGSVKKQFNKLIVEDDYEIVCWDVVAQPSTPSAFIGLKDKDIAPYIESQQKTGKIIKEAKENKFEKFEKWLAKK